LINLTWSQPRSTSLQGRVSGEHLATQLWQGESTRHVRQPRYAATSLAASAETTASVSLKVKSIMVYDHVVLTEEEKELFRILLETKEYFGLSTTLRAAGGWVRDKLIGRNSDDVDIALDDMLGKDFAEKVNEYLALKGEEVHSVGVIQTNPEQSKHLETARVRVRGTWIDLVNLRSEAYAENSRIPTMAFGTPAQDAYRRDLTINSMFYNINENCIEDLTEKGMEDLRAGVIRTPLPPLETFLDDPLRVLRAVRFSARFQFELDPTLVEAASGDEVRVALRDKVSKERVGTEIDAMLKSQDPVEAMRHLLRMRIFNVAFPVPKDSNLPEGQPYGPVCVAVMRGVEAILKELPTDYFTPEERRMCLLAGLLLPLRTVQVKAKKKLIPISSHIVREELKMRTKDAELVVALHNAAAEFATLAGELQMLRSGDSNGDAAGSAVPPSPGETGKGGYPAHLCVLTGGLVKQLKENWRLALPLAAAMDIPCVGSLCQERCALVANASDKESGLGEEETLRRRALCLELEGMVEGMGLARAWEMKWLLDGKTVMTELGMKGGPKLGQIMDAQTRWQFQHPDATADDCRKWLTAFAADQQ